MNKLLPLSRSLALHDRLACQRIESGVISGPSRIGPMERAGAAVAKLALALVGSTLRPRIWVVCGPGNNGGDGLVAARRLHQLGVDVSVNLVAGADHLPADASKALVRAREAGVLIRTGLHHDLRPDLVIDALFGLGLNRPPSPDMLDAFEAINSSGVKTLAVDLPSGLNADTGQPLGFGSVQADHTLALLSLKPGLFTGQGRAMCGQLWFDALDEHPDEAASAWLLGADTLMSWPLPRREDSHKGTHGQVLVVGGAAGMVGAARLAARAALASGAGRVYLDGLSGDAAEPADPAYPELMRWTGAAAMPLSSAVAVVGCGGGEAIARRLPALLEQMPWLVIDADALNAIATDASMQTALAARSDRGQASVLTPHPLEAARLLGCSSNEVQSDRIAAATKLAGRWRCTVVLKGSGSVVASPGRTPAINSTGGPALATAGTGDVLAGWLAGLWAQRTAGAPHDLACAAVYAHGRAGDSQPHGPLLASELIHQLQTAPTSPTLALGRALASTLGR